jgi:Zn-dependent alcohol dehydrogenase
MVLAAVFRGAPRLEIEDLVLAPPGPGEVRLRYDTASICQSDAHVRSGVLPGKYPMVLGHEAAATVVEVGPGAERHRVGDRVIVTPMPQCGTCWTCARGQANLCQRVAPALAEGSLPDGTTRWTTVDGEPVRQLSGVGAFAQEAVVSELSAFGLGAMPFASAAVLGCRVLTGMGAALNTANIRPGDAVVVIGCGVVGLSVIQGARIAGASTIVAVDPLPARREVAQQMGATHAWAPDVDLRREVRGLNVRRGADAVFYFVVAQSTLHQAVAVTRRGGEVILVGVPAADVEFRVPAFAVLHGGLTVKGSWMGSTEFRRDIPRLLVHYRTGELLLDELTTASFDLADIDSAFASVARGDAACALISCR